MNSNLEITLQQLRFKNVTLDCNVFLLFFFGNMGEVHLNRFKRTSAYSIEHFHLLVKLVSNSFIIQSPNVLTEASNLIENYTTQIPNEAFSHLRDAINKMQENYCSSIVLSSNDIFLKLGLADSSIYELGKQGAIPITIDLDLYGYLYTQGIPVINFNHLLS